MDGQGGEGEPLRVPLSALTGQVLVTGGADEVTGTLSCLLGQLGAAAIPWLRVGRLPAPVPDRSAVTVVDLTDPRGVPLTIDPFLPEPGYPEIAHADALSALLEAVFGPPGPHRDVLSLALRGLFAARAPHEPAPATKQIERAVLAASRELGCGKTTENALRGFVRTRLGMLRGPATGMLLGGGHPVEMAELVRRNVDIVTGNLAGTKDRALAAGAVALRVAEHASRFPRITAGVPRHVLVLEEAVSLLRGSSGARQVARLLAEAAARGTGVIVTGHSPVPGAPRLADGAALTIAYQPGTAATAGPAEEPAVPHQPSAAGLISRRMTSCARSCRAGRPCARDEVSAAVTLADAPGQQAAWLRLWARVLLLAFLTGHPLPAPPPSLRAARARQPRIMECALAAITERAVAERAIAVRDCFPGASLTRALTGAAAEMLAGRLAPVAAGQVWVIPHLRWAREATRVGWARVPSPPGTPRRGAVRPGDLAPPLEFSITGLPDWTGILARERLHALLSHPLSLEAAPNRGIAATALFGECGQEAFDAALAADLAVIRPALPSSRTIPATSPLPLSQTARLMDCHGGWLVTVMRWTSSG